MPKTITRKFADPSIVDSQTVLTLDQFLTDVVVGYRDNTYVMDNLLPEKPVRKDSDKIRVVNPEGWFKAAERRAETALPEQAGVQYSEDTYSTDEFALEGWVSDDALRNAIEQIDPLSDEAKFLSEKIMLTQEIANINEIFSASKTAGATHYDILGAAYKWNGGASAAPLDDISKAIKKIVSRTGKRPNIVSLSTDSYEAFVNNTQIRDILKNTTTAVVDSMQPVKAIRGMRLQLADAIVNAGTLDTADMKNIQYDVVTTTQFFDTVIVSYVEKGNPLTLGHNFVSLPFEVFRIRGSEGARRKATLVYVSKKFGPKVTNIGASHIVAKVLG